MARVEKIVILCDRCAFGGEKPATEERRYAIEDRYYLLELCQEHAEMFDRDMSRWTRVSQDIDNPYAGTRGRSEFFTREATEQTRRARELAEKARKEAASRDFAARRAAEIAMEEEQHLRKSLPGALAWALTTHARERMVERGFTLEDLYRTATQPEHTYPQEWRGPDVAIYQRGDCRLAVNTRQQVVITVIDRNDVLETAESAPAHARKMEHAL